MCLPLPTGHRFRAIWPFLERSFLAPMGGEVSEIGAFSSIVLKPLFY
jgi:hypothetical protein